MGSCSFCRHVFASSIWCAFSPSSLSLFTDSHSGAVVCRFEFVYLCNDIADAVYRVTYIAVSHLVEVWKFCEQQPTADGAAICVFTQQRPAKGPNSTAFGRCLAHSHPSLNCCCFLLLLGVHATHSPKITLERTGNGGKWQ